MDDETLVDPIAEGDASTGEEPTTDPVTDEPSSDVEGEDPTEEPQSLPIATLEIASFEKVSFEQFCADMKATYPSYQFDDDELGIYYDEIELPTRKTDGSAGYDICTPFQFSLSPGCQAVIPTGLRVKIDDPSWCLAILPKSRSVFTSMRLSNTIGIIDSDYYNSSNEGHIMLYLELPAVGVLERPGTNQYMWKKNTYRQYQSVHFRQGQSIVQGIFLQFGITKDDASDKKVIRDGGFGSTGD